MPGASNSRSEPGVATRASRTLDRRQLAVNGLLLILWLWLYRPVFAYLQVIFSREQFRSNQILLLGIVLLLLARVRRAGLRWRPDAAPQLAPLPLLLALGGSLLYLLVERLLDVNTVAAALFGLGTYGLLGLWLAPARWRQGLPAALLLIGTLPFGEHMQTFLGYPLRLVTAGIVRDGLAALGAGSLGVDTILVFENGISQVDIPCSGVQSLWTGALFLLAATWVERRSLNRRWLLLALSFSALLLAANVARVAVLVAVGQVMGWSLLAEMMHVPLGVLGFAFASLVAVGLLRRQPPPTPAAKATIPRARPPWLGPALAGTVLLLALAYVPRPPAPALAAAEPWRFPAALHTSALPLTAQETEWLAADGAATAARYRFNWQGLEGSMILISSRTWRAHHRPERCFQVYGLTLKAEQTHLVRPSLPVHVLSLGDERRAAVLSATYWLQSAQQTTDDFGTRMWADLEPEREPWVLVSILFDGVVDPADPVVEGFYLALHEAVSHNLGEQ